MDRLTDNELEALLNELESDRAERKEAWAGDASDKGCQAICAFASDLPNHQKPGVLFVGVEDKGAPKNIAVTDQLLLTLADLKSNGNILPPPTMTVEKRVLKGLKWLSSLFGLLMRLQFGSKVAFGFALGLVEGLLRHRMSESSMRNAVSVISTLRHIRFRHARWRI